MNRLKKYKAIFFDFDGVIKDSNDVKDEGYAQLFEPFGPEVVKKAVAHNIAHGGISRFEKIPMYLKEYAGVELPEAELQEYFTRYSELTVDGVVASDYNEPVIDYIFAQSQQQRFYIVTGSSQDDIDVITERLNIRNHFQGIFGSPQKKPDIIAQVLDQGLFTRAECCMIGDADTDWHAARENDIDFFWVETETNAEVFVSISAQKLQLG